MKLGDKILFASTSEAQIKDCVGIILKKNNEDEYSVLKMTTSGCYVQNRKLNEIEPLENLEQVRQDIKDFYRPQILLLKEKLRNLTADEKVKEKKEKYDKIKYNILRNCERIISCDNDDEFENRLKEINKLKKELYTIELDGASIIRKENASISYSIRQIEQKVNSHLGNISDYVIENIMKNVG